MPGTVSQFALASYGVQDQTMPVPALLPSAETDRKPPGIPSGTATADCEAGVSTSLPPANFMRLEMVELGPDIDLRAARAVPVDGAAVDVARRHLERLGDLAVRRPRG